MPLSPQSSGPQQHHYKTGEYLFREGESSTSLFLLQQGRVAIRKNKAEGEIEIAQIYTNEIIGEVSFFDRQPRSASAVAVTDVQALEIGFDGLDKIFSGIPPYMRAIMISLAERLRKADEQIRKLQNTLVTENGAPPKSNSEEFSAADALAALESVKSDPTSTPK